MRNDNENYSDRKIQRNKQKTKLSKIRQSFFDFL